MSDEPKDRQLDHPIETLRDFTELVHTLDRIATAMENQGQRLTQYETQLRSLIVNDLLWSGAVKLDAAFSWRKSFQVPFAAITVEDTNSLGPLLVVGGESADGNYETQGVGRWKVPVGTRRVVPITNTSLTLTSLAAAPVGGFVYVAVWTAVNTGGS